MPKDRVWEQIKEINRHIAKINDELGRMESKLSRMESDISWLKKIQFFFLSTIASMAAVLITKVI